MAVSRRIIERTPMEYTEDGVYTLDFQVELDDRTESSGTFYFYDREFIDGVAVQQSYYSSGEEGVCHQVIAVAEKQEDGTVTLRAYARQVPESEVSSEAP